MFKPKKPVVCQCHIDYYMELNYIVNLALNGGGHTTQMQIGTCNLQNIVVEESLNLRQVNDGIYHICEL